jgi:hypothetical protein
MELFTHKLLAIEPLITDNLHKGRINAEAPVFELKGHLKNQMIRIFAKR